MQGYAIHSTFKLTYQKTLASLSSRRITFEPRPTSMRVTFASDSEAHAVDVAEDMARLDHYLARNDAEMLIYWCLSAGTR